MTTVLCTLYNSLYLDKGLVLYDSLCACAKDFKLYVLCMDDKCYEVLADLNQEHHIPIRLSDFEEGDEELLEAKANRPMSEYCWTCSSSFIRYVLIHYNEGCCTYIDADMFFYRDPQVLVDEMIEAGKSVLVVPHRFPIEKEILCKTVGTYCVEFNTFLNTPESLEVLTYWRRRCLNCCSNLGDGEHWGDQKYLDEIVERFRGVHVCAHCGAGVAPWNISLYNSFIKEDKSIVYEIPHERIPLVFYHFQGLVYITKKRIYLSLDKKKINDKNSVRIIYQDYLESIDKKKEDLKKKYGVDTLIIAHPTVSFNNWKRVLKSVPFFRIINSLIRNRDGMVITIP